MKTNTATDTPKLTAKEKMRFEICTDTILKALDAEREAGIALIEVMDHKLYREDFKTFDEYRTTMLKISKSRAYQLRQEAEVRMALPDKIADQITNERQIRVLAAIPKEQWANVVKEASKNGDITAASLKAASAKSPPVVDSNQPIESGKSASGTPPHCRLTSSGKDYDKPKPILDDIGTPIPSDALPFWNRKQEIQDLLTEVSRIKCQIEKAMQSEDPMFGNVSQSILSHMTQTYTHLLEAKPYTVCTTCMGSFSVQPKGCSFCKNSGMISKWKWDTQSRKEIKDIRMRGNAERARA